VNRTVCWWLALSLLPVAIGAGQVPVSGRVINSVTGAPVSLAIVTTLTPEEPQSVATTDEAGRFRLLVRDTSRGLVRVSIRRIGYEPFITELVASGATQQGERDILLVPSPVMLDSVVTVGVRMSRKLRSAGFEARRRVGFGTFITEADIAARHLRKTSDAFRLIPGVRVTPGFFGTTVVIARAESSRLQGGPCYPKILVDGTVMPTPVDLDLLLVPEDIAAIEVYKGPAATPAEFGGVGAACGVIAIWTK